MPRRRRTNFFWAGTTHPDLGCGHCCGRFCGHFCGHLCGHFCGRPQRIIATVIESDKERPRAIRTVDAGLMDESTPA